MDTLQNKRIDELVDDNYIYASVLYYFGIEFYHYSEQTLEQVCQKKGLNIHAVVNQLEKQPSCDNQVEVADFPIDLIIEYLKHSHYVFIKQKLPFINNVIQNLEIDTSEFQLISKDLKFIFPLFVEDFIHHIYQEEDTLFNYIALLDQYKKGKGNVSRLYFEMEKHSLSRFASEHEEHDDEMLGIRQITKEYEITDKTPLHLKVIYSELQSLEQELITHARVENDILFPKALILEKQVSNMLQAKVKYN
ncbi:MAG: hemerythrin domain-containing protein [Fulvivirga sp.]|uniref:hemerythrin domain-containing protein n=1 Tax=Fulvivirga sp. TaxID=1931237 RepID=UPI0032EF5399